MINNSQTGTENALQPPKIMLGKKIESGIMLPPEKTRRLATEKHPTIEAITAGLFRFEKKEQAIARLEAIKGYFIISSKLPKDNEENTVKLWIRGYQITDEETNQGYLGNYAAIRIKEVDKKFSLIAEKQRIALKYHPQRVRPKKQHPDWGHPALRVVRKGHIFDTVEEAQKLLMQLHEEYPEISIPNTNKLYLIIYSKALNMVPPIQKFILEIKASREGGFFIEYKANSHNKSSTRIEGKVEAAAAKVTARTAEKASEKATGKPAAEVSKNTTEKTAEKAPAKSAEQSAHKPTDRNAPKEQKGYFTSMVELKKSARKKRATPVRKTKPDTDSTT